MNNNFFSEKPNSPNNSASPNVKSKSGSKTGRDSKVFNLKYRLIKTVFITNIFKYDLLTPILDALKSEN